MATIGDVTIRIGATTRQLESDLKRAERALQKSADKFTDLGEKLSLGVTVPFTAFAAVSLQAFGESEKAIGQVNAALTSTGNTANKTTEGLKETAASLQDISTFDDDEILGKVTANLLTFTSVANEQFDKAQLAIVNLSTRLGTDLQSATLQVGKALNDPIGGLTSLKKAGIQFSDEQKNLIKGLVETNQIAKAQDVILAELEKQFGGSAEAAAKLGLGPLKQLQNQLGNLSEEFGAIIAEAILPLIQFFKNLVGSLQGMDNATKKTIVTLGALFAAVGPILIVIGQMISVYKSVIIQIYKVIGAIVAKASAEKAAAVATNAANASTVAFSTALRATLTVAAPYLALFGAIAGAAFLLYKNFKKAEAAQDQLNGVQQEANKIMAAEKAQGDRLISVINDETKSKQDKKKALNELITISPEYFKGLTIEKDGIEKINSRYKDYVANLKAVSLARAASSKQDELSVKILDLEDEKIRQLAEAQKLETQAKAESERQGASLERQGVNYSRTALENTKKRIKAIDTELIALNKQSDALSNVIEKNSQIKPQGKTVAPEFAEAKTDNKLLETFKGLNDELVILERRFKAGIIDSVEFSQGKVEVLRKKFIELIDAGTDPVNKSVVELKDNIASLQKVSAAPFVAILSTLDGVIVKSDKTKESIKDLADKMGKSFVDISNRSRTDFVERIVSDLQTGMDVIKSFASTMEGTLISAFTLVGETIGQAFTGNADIGNFFNGILQLVANFAKDFGKQLIAIGVAKLALEELFAAGPAGAAAAIVAGTALVAVASALSSSLQKKLPSLDIGTNKVKSDGMAYLHAGEAVVPADVVAGGFTGGSNGTQVYGRLSGIDLLLSNQYAGGYYNRLR